MNSICIIPARGGSKRIPRKNIKDFMGKPIIAYSIAAAVESGLFDEVMVSTDDAEIAQVALKFGAKVPFKRSAENSNDYATTADVLEEVIVNYKRAGLEFSHACCLYPTAPFVTPEYLKEGENMLLDPEVVSVFPVVKFDYPIWRGLKKMESGGMEMVWKEHLNSRSQDLQPVYHDAGQWYWFKVEKFLSSKTVFSDNSKGVEITSLEVQDIDTEHDWQLAELKYGYLQSIK
ncbi:MAG TPA: pseudaminic acid cytidylyltransferase [Lunatimonas sp.]|nr:pseudaminic acid cytidylyltransferase [Lunatimonas sp.]